MFFSALNLRDGLAERACVPYTVSISLALERALSLSLSLSRALSRSLALSRSRPLHLPPESAARRDQCRERDASKQKGTLHQAASQRTGNN